MAKLASNVFVDGEWYGPDYPKAGNPPKDSVTNPAAYGKATEADVREGRAEKVGEQLADSDDNDSDDDQASSQASSSSSSKPAQSSQRSTRS